MSTVSMKSLAALALAGAAVLAGCKPAAEPSTGPKADAPPVAPASPAQHVSRTARLQAFLVQRYGSNAKLSGEWRGSWTDDGDTHAMDWQVCAEQPVVSGDSWQQLLAVCGALVDGAHIDPGTIEFFVLRPNGEGFEVASELTGQRFGSGGQPGTASIIRAGSDFYGFRVEDGWFGQGFSLLSQSLILPGPNGLVASGSVRSHIDNDAQYECDTVDASTDPRHDQRLPHPPLQHRFRPAFRRQRPQRAGLATADRRNRHDLWRQAGAAATPLYPGPEDLGLLLPRIAATRRLRVNHARRRGYRSSLPTQSGIS